MTRLPRLFRVTLITGWLLLMMFGVACAVPNLINYQGVLTQPNGTVVNGPVALQLSLYNVASGGTPLWQETQTVTVAQGVFNVELGAVTPLTLPFNVPYFLGVKAGSDQEMQPRQQLTSVPYALRANIADTIPDQTVTAAKLGETCADGEILRFNAQAGLWQCSSSNETNSFFTTHSGAGVLTIDGITDSDPVVPHDGLALDPYENILVFDFTAFDILVSGSEPGADHNTSAVASIPGPLTVLCDPNGKGPAIFEKIIRGQILLSIALWLPDASGAFSKLIEIHNARILSQDTVSPERPGDESLIQYSITGEIIKIFGNYFNNPGSYITYNTQDRTTEGSCGQDIPDFVLDHGLNSSLSGERIDSIQFDVSVLPPGPVGSDPARPSFSAVVVRSSLNSSTLCLIANALRTTSQSELSIKTLSAINPDTEESELILGAARVTSCQIFLDSHGIPKQQFSLGFDTINASYTTIDLETGQSTGTTEFGWDVEAGAPPH